MGRPGKYKPAYCEDLLAHMAAGGSYETFPGYLGSKYGSDAIVCRQTLYNWENQNPEFLDTKKRAVALSYYFWEKLGLDALRSREPFNNTLWIFNMKNRFSWGDNNPKMIIDPDLIDLAKELEDPELRRAYESAKRTALMTDEEREQRMKVLKKQLLESESLEQESHS